MSKNLKEEDVIMADETKRDQRDNVRKHKTEPREAGLERGVLHQLPLVSASNVDQELGWTREEYKKIGVKYQFMRAVRENDWYPHYIHNLDNLIRFGGLFPAGPGSRGHPQDQAPGRDARAEGRRRHDGARQG